MKKKLLDISVTTIFCAVIFIPICLTFLGVNFNDNKNQKDVIINNGENSIKQKYKNLIKAKDEFNDSFEKNFIFKDLSIKAKNNLVLSIFGTSSIPKKVVIGNNGWYFLGENYSDAIRESKGISNFEKSTLDSLNNQLIENNKYLKNKNINYYTVIAPNKSSIYGNFLNIKAGTKKKKIDQIIQKSKGNYKVIDLTPALENKASSEKLYYKTDSHWNYIGAYYGYLDLIKVISKDFPEIKPVSITDYIKQDTVMVQMDLTKMLKYSTKEHDFILRKTEYLSREKNSNYEAPQNYQRQKKLYSKKYISKKNKIKVVMFRDSFSKNMENYLRETFGELTLIWHPLFNKNIIESEQPDIVIHQVVERDIDRLLHPKNK